MPAAEPHSSCPRPQHRRQELGYERCAAPDRRRHFSVFRLVSGTQIDRFNFETLAVVDQQLDEFVRAIRQSRCSQAKTMDGMMRRCEERLSMFAPGF